MRQFDRNGQWLLDVKELFVALGGSKWNNLNNIWLLAYIILNFKFIYYFLKIEK